MAKETTSCKIGKISGSRKTTHEHTRCPSLCSTVGSAAPAGYLLSPYEEDENERGTPPVKRARLRRSRVCDENSTNNYHTSRHVTDFYPDDDAINGQVRKSRRSNGTHSAGEVIAIGNTSGFRCEPVVEAFTPRKLILHFDVRNTVLVADSIGSLDVRQALNSYLTTVTWGWADPTGQWKWFNYTPSLTPPHKRAITYYKYLEKKMVQTAEDRAKLRLSTGNFTDPGEIGAPFAKYFDKHLKLLEWKHVDKPVAELTMAGKEGKLYHYLLPAVFKLIVSLEAEGRDYAIVLRTYGRDGGNVLKGIKSFMEGNHPEFPNRINIPVKTDQGQIDRSESTLSLKCPTEKGYKEYSSDREIYNMLSSVHGVCGFVDDFNFWQKNGYLHTAGKPLWVDLADQRVQHIIFDDNIRVLEEDNIVDVRQFFKGSDSSVSLTNEEMKCFENLCLVQADLIESIENVDYYKDKVKECERNYTNYIESFN